MTRIVEKTVRWLFFGILLAMVPLGYAYISLLVKDKSPSLQSILADGGLLLVVSSFCASALGEMIGTSSNFLVWKLIGSGATMILLVLSTLVFASIAEARLATHMNEGLISGTSLIVFVCAALSSTACIALSET